MKNEKLRADIKRELNRPTSMKKLAELLNRCYVALGEQQSVPVKITDQMNQAGAAHQREQAKGLVEALVEVTASLEWNAHGRCRGVNDGPIMPSSMAIEFAQQALATYHAAQEGK